MLTVRFILNPFARMLLILAVFFSFSVLASAATSTLSVTILPGIEEVEEEAPLQQIGFSLSGGGGSSHSASYLVPQKDVEEQDIESDPIEVIETIEEVLPTLEGTNTLVEQFATPEEQAEIIALMGEGFDSLEEMEALVESVLLRSNQAGTLNSSVSHFDYSTHWAKTHIELAKLNGVASGKNEGGHFEPDAPVTRAEFTKMLVNALGYEVADSVSMAPFKDVDPSDWYAPYVAVAKNSAYVQGYEGGYFYPNRQVSRAEVLKVLSVGMMEFSYEPQPNEDVLARFSLVREPYVDVQVGKWYAPYVLYSHRLNLVQGYNDFTFRPNSSMTRAESTKLIMESLKFMHSEEGRDSLLSPLQLSEEGLDPEEAEAVDSGYDFSLWKRIRRWAF